MSPRRSMAVNLDLLIERAQAHGLIVEAVEITVDGSPRVLTRRPSPGVALNDDADWVAFAGETKDYGRA